MLVPGREGTGMLSFCSASESDDRDELSDVDVDAGFVLVLAFELEPEGVGRTERRLSFSGELGATLATELAVGCAKLKENERRWWRGVGLVGLGMEVDASLDAGLAGVNPSRGSALDTGKRSGTHGQRVSSAIVGLQQAAASSPLLRPPSSCYSSDGGMQSASYVRPRGLGLLLQDGPSPVSSTAPS